MKFRGPLYILEAWPYERERERLYFTNAVLLSSPNPTPQKGLGEGSKNTTQKLQSNRYNQYYSVLVIQHNPSVANRVKKYSLNHNKFALKSEFVFCLEMSALAQYNCLFMKTVSFYLGQACFRNMILNSGYVLI